MLPRANSEAGTRHKISPARPSASARDCRLLEGGGCPEPSINPQTRNKRDDRLRRPSVRSEGGLGVALLVPSIRWGEIGALACASAGAPIFDAALRAAGSHVRLHILPCRPVAGASVVCDRDARSLVTRFSCAGTSRPCIISSRRRRRTRYAPPAIRPQVERLRAPLQVQRAGIQPRRGPGDGGGPRASRLACHQCSAPRPGNRGCQGPGQVGGALRLIQRRSQRIGVRPLCVGAGKPP